jgi:hypothetical protein
MGYFKAAHERDYLVKEDKNRSYSELSAVADRILEEGEDDPDALAQALDRLDPGLRDDLLISDLLNAFQVFYYYFREEPGELERERLILEPASALSTGVRIIEIEFYEVFFRVESGEPVISVHAGPVIVANYRGSGAYQDTMQFLDDTL